jgi:hypothetical protein
MNRQGLERTVSQFAQPFVLAIDQTRRTAVDCRADQP